MSTALTTPAATIVDNKTGKAESIDAAAFQALRSFLRALGVAYADEKAAKEEDVCLTTGQAAAIVGASQRTIARLVDSGKLKGSRTGTGHRHIMLSDLMEFDREAKKSRGANLERMRTAADGEGMYDKEYNNAATEYLRSFE